VRDQVLQAASTIEVIYRQMKWKNSHE